MTRFADHTFPFQAMFSHGMAIGPLHVILKKHSYMGHVSQNEGMERDSGRSNARAHRITTVAGVRFFDCLRPQDVDCLMI